MKSSLYIAASTNLVRNDSGYDFLQRHAWIIVLIYILINYMLHTQIPWWPEEALKLKRLYLISTF